MERTMKGKLLQYLACPNCKGDFVVRVDEKDENEIVSGNIKCSNCNCIYPIRNGIPRILYEATDGKQKETAEFFSKDWKIFPTLDLKHNKQLMQEYIEPLTLQEFENKIVLEAGCGSGRNMLVLAENAPKDIIGLDISESVDVAYNKTKSYQNIHLVQGDILNPPFKRCFDIVYSVGCLHHLQIPRNGFGSLVKFLKPTGIIAISVYGKENNEWINKYINPLRKKIFSKFQTFSLILSFIIAFFLYPILTLIYRPLNKMAISKRFAQKYLFYNDFLYLLSKLGFKVLVGQIWDQITAPTANYHTKDELKEWFVSAGLKNIRNKWRNRNCWNFVGQRD